MMMELHRVVAQGKLIRVHHKYSTFKSKAQRCWRWAADGARGRGSVISRISKFYRSYRLEKLRGSVKKFLGIEE